ncbi:hypothetical protein IHE45_12G052600 [Dioscorea alata]|uniref:Uncharacterized protein n=1 Tax=Dioscorea alata TaxID=55571 RepID=A0ACB7V254_DIOAL|nr:hypothetical protein IHE45_12G052600 [Dioscorea alata]
MIIHTSRRDLDDISIFLLQTRAGIQPYSLTLSKQPSLPDPSLCIIKQQAISITARSDICLSVIHSSNGLLLCRAMVPDGNSYPMFYYIYNPITMKFKHVSISKANNRLRHVVDTILLPDHRVLVLEEEFVFINTTYKYHYHISIYSSTSCVWKTRRKPLDIQGKIDVKIQGVFWNGTANWVSTDHKDGDQHVVSVNTKNYEIRKILLEENEEVNPKYFSYLGESRGQLHLIVHSDYQCLQFSIMEAVRDFSVWRHLYYVDLRSLFWYMISNSVVVEVTPLYVFRGVKEEDDKLLMLVNENMIMSCNLTNMTYYEICNIGKIGRRGIPKCVAFPLNPSFSSAF